MRLQAFTTQYHHFLCSLISHKSVFTDDRGIKNALNYCNDIITKHNPGRNTYFDAKGNLISISKLFDRSKNAIYLSAHIDTVGAVAAEWASSKNPFVANETTTHVIGRGANDCKAGVAFIMLLSYLADKININNIVFLISYREEGNQEKTSGLIGKSLGDEITLSNRNNLLLCLENTVSVHGYPYSIGIYDSEPCNLFIEIIETVPKIREFLTSNRDWKPVFISPIGDTGKLALSNSYTAESGHIATTANSDNLIYRSIMNNTSDSIVGGDYLQTSVIRNCVNLFESPTNAIHQVVLNYRGLESVQNIERSIAHIRYTERFPFLHGEGSDRRISLQHSLIKKLITEMKFNGIRPAFMTNPGRSDASAIWNAITGKEKMDILTMGPGTRSHFDGRIIRKTHGPDEGFHKEAGSVAVQYIFDIINEFLVA